MAYELRDFSDIAPATTVGVDITNVSTSITIASGTGYPSGGASGDFMVQIESELIRCSSRSGNTLTTSGGVAGRGQNGTTAVGHVAGTTVNHVLTATNDAKEANRAVAKTIGVATTTQDLLVADAANSFSRLPIGTNGTILQALAGLVAYGALPANSVGASQITDGTVGSAELAASAVIAGKVAAGALVNADINAAAAIALSKLATDPLARANHTGTQLAATVSNFDTQVRTSTLNQMTAPTADLSINTHKLTGVSTPTASTDAATKGYVDGVVPTAFSTYTPVVRQGGSAKTLTVNYAKYVVNGHQCTVWFDLTITQSGSGSIDISLPVACDATSGANTVGLGGVRHFRTLGFSYLSEAFSDTAVTTRCALDFSTLIATQNFANGDNLHGILNYPV